jgi:hypothetical protein
MVVAVGVAQISVVFHAWNLVQSMESRISDVLHLRWFWLESTRKIFTVYVIDIF